jgi:hypothetical protein
MKKLELIVNADPNFVKTPKCGGLFLIASNGVQLRDPVAAPTPYSPFSDSPPINSLEDARKSLGDELFNDAMYNWTLGYLNAVINMCMMSSEDYEFIYNHRKQQQVG